MAGLEGHGYTDSMDDIVELKNATVRTLQEELERLINSHNTSVQRYEQTMVDNGVPAEELGFLPKLLSETAVGEMTRAQTDTSLWFDILRIRVMERILRICVYLIQVHYFKWYSINQ